MSPALYELFILTIMGLSGTGLGLLLGVTRPIPLAALGFGVSVVIRTISSFSSWTLQAPHLAWETWLGLSVVIIALAAVLKGRIWREWFTALGVFELAGLVALAMKYVFAWGERHHSDSANTVSLALISIQREASDLGQLSLTFKRGIAYPLMLGLGPEGRILGLFTPLVMIVTLILVTWVIWRIVPDGLRGKGFWISVAAIWAFSLSVPMFRASFTYLNGHTLMGLGLALMMAGLLLSRKQQRLSTEASAFLAVGASIGATARVEGIALVAIFLVAIASERFISSRPERIRLGAVFASAGLSLTWWLASLDSPVLDRFGVSAWVLAAATVVGSIVVALRWVDPLRKFLLPAVAVVLAGLLANVIFSSGDPMGMLLAQWPNLGLGVGGWATAAHMFVGSVVVLGLKSRSRDYRLLLTLVILTLGAILFSKTFDGGFGRASFYDSVNRMWLHAMPLIYALTVLGYTELLSQWGSRRKVVANTEEAIQADKAADS